MNPLIAWCYDLMINIFMIANHEYLNACTSTSILQRTVMYEQGCENTKYFFLDTVSRYIF